MIVPTPWLGVRALEDSGFPWKEELSDPLPVGAVLRRWNVNYFQHPDYGCSISDYIADVKLEPEPVFGMTAAEKRAYYGIEPDPPPLRTILEMGDGYWAGYHGFKRMADWRRVVGSGGEGRG